MSCIIRMTSGEFLDKFIKKHDYRKFNFLLISENITTDDKYRNVYAGPSLIPPQNIISTFIHEGYTERYVKKYLDYLQTPRVEALITAAVKLAIIDNSNVIMVCSEAEAEFKYIDIICQYIETVYGVKTYTYKQYRKNPEKCEAVSDKVKKRAGKILEKKIRDIEDIESFKPSKKEVREIVAPLSKKQIIQVLKANGIKHDPDDSKKKLRKLLAKMIASGRVR